MPPNNNLNPYFHYPVVVIRCLDDRPGPARVIVHSIDAALAIVGLSLCQRRPARQSFDCVNFLSHPIDRMPSDGAVLAQFSGKMGDCLFPSRREGGTGTL